MDTYLTHYQSANISDQEIIDNFIVRKSDFEKVMSDIRTTKEGSSFKHYIFVGRRGSGKSTLLRRIQAELNIDEKLNKKYVNVNLGEEQSGIYKMYDLWDYVIRDLNELGFNIGKAEYKDYNHDLKAYTKKLHLQIIESLRAQQKGLILLIDNIDRILNNLGEDTDLLRELLMNYLDIRIIGGSTYMSEKFWKHDMPFYQFFSIRTLEALSLHEIEMLLDHWSKVKNLPEIGEIKTKHPGKIQSIRMLTDGTPRTMLMFVDMLINRPQQNGYDYLKIIVDKATPIYQERLGVMTPAQRKVVTELSFFWEATAIDQLAPKCNMEGKTVSAILNQLYKTSYVEKIKGKTKNLLYRLEERFFNLWLIMTQGGPQQKREAKYLSEFLETWYDPQQLNKLCEELINVEKKNTLKTDYLNSMSRALLGAKTIDLEQKKKMYLTFRNDYNLKEEIVGKADDFFENIDFEISRAFELEDYDKALRLLIASSAETGKKNFGLGLAFQKMGQFNKAEQKYLESIENENYDAAVNLAGIYYNRGDEERAKKYYLQAIELGSEYGEPLNILGIISSNQRKEVEAEKFYLQAIEYGNVNALNNLALLYAATDRVLEAEQYYLQAIKNDHIDALFNLANLYKKQGRIEEAEKYYLRAIENKQDDALFNLANLYFDQNKMVEAEKFYLSAIGLNDSDAMCNLGYLYEVQERFEMAEQLYLKSIDQQNQKGLFNLANLFNKQGKINEAEQFYLKAIEKQDVGAMNNLALMYEGLGKYEQAEQLFKKAIDLGHINAMINLVRLYENQKKINEAEKYYLKAIQVNNKEALLRLVSLFFDQGRIKKVEKYLLLSLEHGEPAALSALFALYYDENDSSSIEKLLKEHSNLIVQIEDDILIIIYLYLGELNKFNKIIQRMKSSPDDSWSADIITIFLIHKQTNLVLQIFENPEIKDKFKPLYFAALQLNQKDHPDLLRMPPEIAENVGDIISTIKEKQQFYYG